MSDEPRPPTLEAERSLHVLAERCGGRFPPSNAEIEAALERGATSLIVLEARLQKVQANLAVAPSGEAERSRQELAKQIASLLDALAELRSRVRETGSPLAQGFVLPSDE
jgi:hypothetical protein